MGEDVLVVFFSLTVIGCFGFCVPWQVDVFLHRGSQLYFHITWYVLKEGRTLCLLPKVKVEFRHLFSLQKRFSLCSSHKINANTDVFC